MRGDAPSALCIMVGTNSAQDLPTVHALAPLGTFQPLGGLIGEIWPEQIDASSATPAGTTETRIFCRRIHATSPDSVVFTISRGDHSEHHATQPHRLRRISLWKKRTFLGIKCPLRESSTRNTGFAVLGFFRISLSSCELRKWTNIGNVAATQSRPVRAVKHTLPSRRLAGFNRIPTGNLDSSRLEIFQAFR